jgi:hypothetical protein
MNNFAIIQRSSWTKRKIGLAAKINVTTITTAALNSWMVQCKTIRYLNRRRNKM